MSAPLPPIYRDCQRLLRHTEAVVLRFSRYHKYTVGTDLRQQAFAVMRTAHRAVYDKPQQARHVQALVWLVDDYKLTLQLAMDIGAFVHGKCAAQKPTSPGFAPFESAAQLAAGIGKQCGGWLKKSFGQITPAQADAKPASGQHAQVGNGASPPMAAGLQPGATCKGVPQAGPASLSARAASAVPTPPGLQPGRAGAEATP
jgi:hypothetical protein